MFGAELAIAQIVMAQIMMAQAERDYFEKSIKDLPEDMKRDLRTKREAEREKARQEATAERRHREMCDAIRSTGFWRF